MKTNMEFLRRKSLMFGAFQGFIANFDDERRSGFNSSGNMPIFALLMVGLVIASIMIASGISNARAALGPHAEGVGEGHQIHPLDLGDQNSAKTHEGGLLPADQEFALAWAAAADALAAAAPLRALPTDKQHELATMAPAEPSDLTIGLRFASPIYLAFLSLPSAPDPMPVPNARQPIWPGFIIFLVMVMMTVVALTPQNNQALRLGDC